MSKTKETDVLIIIIDTHDRFFVSMVERTHVLGYLKIVWGTVQVCDSSQITSCLYSLSLLCVLAGVLSEIPFNEFKYVK